MKKRWIAVILTAMTLAALLAGCGGAAEKPSGTLDTPTPTAQPTEAPEETAAPEETPAPDETMLTLGTIQGGRYENETLGIGAEFDSDWLIADREELNALGGLAAEVITDEELRAAMEKADYFYDLYARTEDNALLVQLVFEKLNAVAAALYDEDKYAVAVKDQIADSFAKQGAKSCDVEKVTLDFAGAERTALNITVEFEGGFVYEKAIFFQTGGYMATLTLISSQSDFTDDMTGLFFGLDD